MPAAQAHLSEGDGDTKKLRNESLLSGRPGAAIGVFMDHPLKLAPWSPLSAFRFPLLIYRHPYMFKKISSLLAGAALLAVLAGCETTVGVPLVNPVVVQRLNSVNKAALATVVIYREINNQDQGITPTILMNGDRLIKIRNGTAFVAAFRPGHYVFETDDRKSGTAVDLLPGKIIYLKVQIVLQFLGGYGRLLQMAPEQGRFEATRLDLLPPNAVLMPGRF